MMRARIRRTLPLLVAAVAAWASCGVVSPLAGDPAARVGILPPFGWLSGAVMLALAIGLTGSLPAARVRPLYLSAAALLPWIPVSAPVAFLLWQGPMLAALWTALLIAIAWPAVVRAGRRLVSFPPTRQAIAAGLIALCLYVAAAWRMAPVLPDGDEPHYLVITQSLLYDGDLAIENNHREHEYLAYTARALKPDYLRRGTDGAIYSIHAPGLPAVVLPAFAIAGYPAVVLWLSLLSAAGAALVWLASRRVTGSEAAAWFGWAAAALTAPFFFQAFTVFPDALGAVLTMSGVYALVAPHRLRGVRTCVLHGAALALLPWLHTRYVVIAVVLGVTIVLRLAWKGEQRSLRALAFASVPLVSALGWFAFFSVLYGTPNPAAPYGGHTQSTWSNAPRGLTGLLLDQQFGLAANAPVLLTALAGLGVMIAGAHRRLGLELTAVVVPYAVAVASYQMWWGGHSSPDRFLVPVLLPLGVAAAIVFDRVRMPHWRTGLVSLLLMSIALSLASAWADRGALVYNPRDGYARALDALAPLVSMPLALPSLFRGGPAQAWAIAGAWLACAVIAAAAVVAVLRKAFSAVRGSTIDPRIQAATAAANRRTVIAGAWLVFVMAGCSAGWTIASARARAVDPGAGVMRLVNAASRHPGWEGVRLPAWQRMPALAWVRTLDIPSTTRAIRRADAWFAAQEVPAGVYVVRGAFGPQVSGHLSLSTGTTARPFADVMLDGASADALTTIALPLGAEQLTIAADRDLARAAGPFSLGILRLDTTSAAMSAPRATRAARWNGVTVWLAGPVYPEASGFWVRGGATASLALITDRPRVVRVVLRNGAVPNRIHLQEAGSPDRPDPTAPMSLAPDERRPIDVRVPGGSVAAYVWIESEEGFRPARVAPATTDVRLLGVWVEIE